MTTASIIPALGPAEAPVSFLVDFDGTISRRDIVDELLTHHATDTGWYERALDYSAGRVGSRELMTYDFEILPDDPRGLQATAAAVPLDEGFVRLVGLAEFHGAQVEVVSDGLGFYIEPMLAGVGLSHVPIATNRVVFDNGQASISHPFGHPHCFVCGTCKRERVRAHQRSGRYVVFIGDGTSDRFAAAHADLIFAKAALARICGEMDWPFQAWDRLDDIARWVADAFADGRLPRTTEELDRGQGPGALTSKAFICGPEVWGPDRTTLPARETSGR